MPLSDEIGLKTDVQHCPNCGAETPPGTNFQPNCSHCTDIQVVRFADELEAELSEMRGRQDRWEVLFNFGLLCILTGIVITGWFYVGGPEVAVITGVGIQGIGIGIVLADIFRVWAI